MATDFAHIEKGGGERMNSDLSVLESNMKVKLFDWGVPTRQLTNKGIHKFLDSQCNSTPFGILVRVDEQSSMPIRILSLMLVSMRISMLRRQLLARGGRIRGKFGVYPSVEEPVAIYSLGARAEQYSNRCILPAFTSGLSGMLRRFIMRLVGFHPSIAGVVILGCKRE